MQSVPREWLDFLRQQFPKDSRIQLTEIGGNPRPISPGSTGKLDYIDDAGQFHVKWDNGCTLALVLGEDRFSVYLPEPQTFKLYMPLTADFYGRDEWGDMSEDGEEWDGHTLMDYEGQILSALVKNRVPEENESGLMRWYGEDDSVDHKVRSAVFTVEVRNRQLWGVAECRVAGELTPEALTILKEYLGGQASDGWGEGFEQRPIEVDGGELYVHLWQPDDWSIQTEQERFAPKVAEGLPELCFSTLRTTGQLICIKRGETGYYPSDWDTGDKEGNVELADELNEDLGVTPIQRERKLTGVYIVRQSTGQAALRKCDLLDPAAELPDCALQLLGSGSVIVAAFKAANGNAVTAQGVDLPAQLRTAHLEATLQLPAGDGIRLALVVKRKMFREGFIDCHRSSFPEPLSRNRRQNERKKRRGRFSPSGKTAPWHISYSLNNR